MPPGAPLEPRRQPLFVLAGPTASGKTEFATKLAKRTGGAIVNVDSVQVYRGFDIGSGKPNPLEREHVPHHLLDILDPPEDLDAMRFAALADKTLEALADAQTPAIVTAGTGLWLRALLRGLVPLPAVDQEIRAHLEAEVEKKGSPALFARVARVDPITAAQIHPHDALRIVRALEVYEQTGTPLGELRKSHHLGTPRYDTTLVVIDEPPEHLTTRIETRIDHMLEMGWVRETRDLLERWEGHGRPFFSVGYREVVQHIRGAFDLAGMRQAIRKATRQYARRQRTWFRGEPGVTHRLSRKGLQEQLELFSLMVRKQCTEPVR